MNRPGIEILIRVRVQKPTGQAIGIKEDFAMYCERFGDSEILSVTEAQAPVQYEQAGLFDRQQRN